MAAHWRIGRRDDDRELSRSQCQTGSMNGHSDVIVVGAGLAGLAPATRLVEAGQDIMIFEAGSQAGGRMRTDHIDGFQLDRGFHVFNPAYPEARGVLDLDALDLHPFAPGIAVRDGARLHLLAHPIRSPQTILQTLGGPGSLPTKLAVARWLGETGFGPTAWIRKGGDSTLDAALNSRGIHGDLRKVMTQFLTGVLGEDQMETSRRFTDMLVRSFVRGRPSLPGEGIQAIPNQLASRLPEGVLRLNAPVREVAAHSVTTDAGHFVGDRVIVATDPRTAAVLTRAPTPAMRSVTTYYHRLQTPPPHARWLHIDLAPSGPVTNVAVVSAVAPGYAEQGVLVASTVLGVHDQSLEPVDRRHASVILGVSESTWTFIRHYAIVDALPRQLPHQPMRRRESGGGGILVAGDHRDTPSVQGALVSGRRVAEAVPATA